MEFQIIVRINGLYKMSITENIRQLSTVSNWLIGIQLYKNRGAQYNVLMNKNFWHHTDETFDR